MSSTFIYSAITEEASMSNIRKWLGDYRSVVLASLITVLLIGLLVRIYLVESSLIGTLTTAAPAISAFASIVLVLVTYQYTLTTKRMVQETVRSRKARVRPEIIFEFPGETYYGHIEKPSLTNVGQGPAINLKATIAFEPDGPSCSLAQRHLQGGASFPIYQQPFESLIRTDAEEYEEYEYIRLEWSCIDRFENNCSGGEEVSLERIQHEAAQSGMTPINIG